MKEIFFHLGILMALLTLMSGIWEHYGYAILILKTIGVFVIWISTSFITHSLFHWILKSIKSSVEFEEPANKKKSK